MMLLDLRPKSRKLRFQMIADMYVPPVVAKQIRELGIRAREVFEICKAELHEENKRWIEWRVRRIEEPRHPASSDNVSEGAASVLNNEAQSHRNGSTHQTARPLDLQASPDGTLLPVPVTGAGITAMELAMSGATEIAQRVETRARMRNYSLQFTNEDIRGYWTDHVHPGHAGARCDMGSALRTGPIPSPFVQLSFPAPQDLRISAALESSATELIVTPEVALAKLPPATGVTARTDPAPVLSPARSDASSIARR
jgi:hypothetical protein